MAIALQSFREQVAARISLKTRRREPALLRHRLRIRVKRHSSEREAVSLGFYLREALEVLRRCLVVFGFLTLRAMRADQPEVAAIHIETFDVNLLLRPTGKLQPILEVETLVAAEIAGRVPRHSIDGGPFVPSQPKVFVLQNNSRQIVTSLCEVLLRDDIGVEMQDWRVLGCVWH